MRMYDIIMNKGETTDLTMTMLKSGDKIYLNKIIEFKVGKYSTRGVRDQTSIWLTPLVAYLYVTVTVDNI